MDNKVIIAIGIVALLCCCCTTCVVGFIGLSAANSGRGNDYYYNYRP